MDLDCTAKDHHLVFWPDCQALPWDIREQMAVALSPCLTETQHTFILADCTTNAMRMNKLKLLTYLPDPLNVLKKETDLATHGGMSLKIVQREKTDIYLLPVDLFSPFSSSCLFDLTAVGL